MSHTGRKGETPTPRRRRGNRCFEIDGHWYFATRGVVYVGPFPTQDAANKAAGHLVDLIRDVDDPDVVHAFVREFSRRADQMAKAGRATSI